MTILKKIVMSAFITVAAWIAMHFLALLGLFLVLLSIVFWLLQVKLLPCNYTIFSKNKKYCAWCGVKVMPHFAHFPQNLRSIIYNCMFILAISLVSLAFVYAEFSFLGLRHDFGIARSEEKEISFTDPEFEGDYYIGEIITMPITVKKPQLAINAVQADIGFDPKSFEVMDIQTDESFATIFIEKEINNDKGYARLTGGLPNPGFSGEQGLFATVLLRSKRAGNLNVYFLPTSQILANDGNATNMFTESYAVSFKIRNESIPQELRLEQEKKLLKRSGLSHASPAPNQHHFYSEGNVLGAKTSKELEQANDQVHLEDQESILFRIDRAIVRLWLSWLVKES